MWEAFNSEIVSCITSKKTTRERIGPLKNQYSLCVEPLEWARS